jgi:outer membrane lipoprotein-sorting protein
MPFPPLKQNPLLFFTLAFALAFLAGSGQAKAELSANEIMEKVDARDDGDHMTADMGMILIDKNGNQRARSMKSFSRDKGRDTWKIMFFTEPADVKDTGFLTYDYRDPEKDDDQWMYLPALKKIKRIASSDQSKPFMGSDFSYADMNKRDIENFNYKILKQDKVRGHDCWIIESIPKSDRVVMMYGYTKSILIVRKDIFMVVRGINFVREGKKLKYFDTEELKQIDGIWVATKVTMRTVRGKQTLHKTVFTRNNVKFNQNLDWDLFTKRRLAKGL